MLGRGSAASTDQAHSGRHEFLRVTRHVLGGAKINIPALDRAWHAGIRLRGQGKGSHRAHAFNRIQHRHRPNAAVTPDYVRAPIGQFRRKRLRIGAVEAVCVLIHRDRRDHRQLGIYVAGGQHRLMQFLDIAEGFQDEKIHAAFGQGCNLFPKSCARLLEGSLAQRFNSNSQRANRTGNIDIEALGGVVRQTRARPVDLVDLVRQTVPSESKAVRTKCVGFNNFCASLQITLMHRVNHFRLREVQFVIGTVDENTVRVQQCAHRSIAKNGRLAQPGKEVRCHTASRIQDDRGFCILTRVGVGAL